MLQLFVNQLGHINLIISYRFSSPPTSPFFLPHEGFFAPLVAKGGQFPPFIVGTLLEQSKKIAF